MHGVVQLSRPCISVVRERCARLTDKQAIAMQTHVLNPLEVQCRGFKRWPENELKKISILVNSAR